MIFKTSWLRLEKHCDLHSNHFYFVKVKLTQRRFNKKIELLSIGKSTLGHPSSLTISMFVLFF